MCHEGVDTYQRMVTHFQHVHNARDQSPLLVGTGGGRHPQMAVAAIHGLSLMFADSVPQCWLRQGARREETCHERRQAVLWACRSRYPSASCIVAISCLYKTICIYAHKDQNPTKTPRRYTYTKRNEKTPVNPLFKSLMSRGRTPQSQRLPAGAKILLHRTKYHLCHSLALVLLTIHAAEATAAASAADVCARRQDIV
jgi:hypothetical protein